jgi:hypothetical protein
MAGASIHQNLFPDGCEFRLISNEPRDTLGNSWFRLVEFEHRRTGEDPDNPAHYTGTRLFVGDSVARVAADRATEKHGDFSRPKLVPAR